MLRTMPRRLVEADLAAMNWTRLLLSRRLGFLTRIGARCAHAFGDLTRATGSSRRSRIFRAAARSISSFLSTAPFGQTECLVDILISYY